MTDSTCQQSWVSDNGTGTERWEREIRNTLEATSALTGEKLFRALVRHLASTLRVRYALIAEWTDETRTRMKTLASWAGGEFDENFEFDVAGSPLENARPNEIRYHGQRVQELYAGDRRLAELSAESYIGIQILNSSGNPTGHLAALHDAPLPDRTQDEWIVRVLAARAGVEIERRQTEQRLRAQDERYALATAAARVGVWDWDVPSGDFYLDPNVKAILGYTDEEIPNDLDRWSDHIHPDDRARVMGDATAALEAGSTEYVCEHRMVHKDKSVRWIMARGKIVRDNAGQVVRMLGTDADITERKQMEEALRTSQARYRDLIEQVPAATYTAAASQTNVVLYMSPQIEAMTGFSPSEWCADSSRWRRQLHPEDREDVLSARSHSLAHGEPVVSEYRLITKDGREIWIRDQGRVVRDDSDRPICFQGLMIDITAQRRLQAEFLAGQKRESLSVLAGGVADDFKNLLVPIRRHASLALEELPPASPVRDHVQQIEKAAVRAADLTQQMLAYAGRGKRVVASLDLNRIIVDMAPLLSSTIPKKAVLDRVLAQDLPRLEADASQLRQLITNLVSNASDALGEASGSISLRTGVVEPGQPSADEIAPDNLAEGAHVFLEVSDTGVGIDEDTQRKMFDPFFTTTSHGRGMGLAAARQVACEHGGTIAVRSSPGRGATIRVYFPAS